MELSKEILDKYFSKLKGSLHTGIDKVNSEKFEEICNDEYETIIRKIDNNTYSFTGFKSIKSNNRIVFIPTIRDRLVLEYLKDNIKKKYNVRINNRDNIIKSIQRQLCEKIDYYIIRMDIKSFFDSIPVLSLLNKVEKSTLLRTTDYLLLRKLLHNKQNGVFQGISLSNYLSEIYLEMFDIRLKRIHPRILYSYRYVDDILLLITGRLTKSDISTINDNLFKLFNDFGIQSNVSKEKHLEFLQSQNSDCIDYLGYSFKRKIVQRSIKLITEISNNKMSKIFSKINRIFSSFYNNNDFDLLYQRLLTLMSIQKITRTVEYQKDGENKYYTKSIILGINFHYQLADDESFRKIDRFIKYKLSVLNYPDRETKNKLFSLSILNRKNENKVIIYKNIPIYKLRSQVNKYSNMKYYEILSMNKKQLAIEYFKILNI